MLAYEILKRTITMKVKVSVEPSFRKYALPVDGLFFYFHLIFIEIQLLGHPFLRF